MFVLCICYPSKVLNPLFCHLKVLWDCVNVCRYLSMCLGICVCLSSCEYTLSNVVSITWDVSVLVSVSYWIGSVSILGSQLCVTPWCDNW